MRFIEQPGNQQGAPPYYFQGVQVRSFPMPADMGALGDYCRRYLNLFAQLDLLRAAAPMAARQPQNLPLVLDPLRLFAGFASQPPQAVPKPECSDPPDPVRQFRQALWQQLLQATTEDQRPALLAQLRAKHYPL
jgi:hypothetical protein